MKQFFKIAAAAAFMATAIPAAAEAACIAGVCPTATGTTVAANPIPPKPVEWQSMVKFNSGWNASTDGQAMGIGKTVDTTSKITENYQMNSLGSVMVDPNCRANCGEQTLTSNWDLMQKVENLAIVNNTGTGTSAQPVVSRAGTMSMGAFTGFMGSAMFTGVPPLSTTPLPTPIGDGAAN